MKYIVIVLIILSTTSCKKEESETQDNKSFIDVELKNNFAFNEGSYWVYQNQSLSTDSVVLSNFETGFTSICPDNACLRNEFIELTFVNLTQGTSFNHYLMSNFIRYNGEGVWGQDGQPIYIFNRNVGSGFNGLLVSEKFDSLTVLNEVFYDVEKMTVVADLQFQDEFDFDRDFYFVPSVGIVRTVIYDTLNGTVTWDLKNYSIE